MSRPSSLDISGWIHDYRAANRELLDSDPDFCRWLDDEYVPIGGGWQY